MLRAARGLTIWNGDDTAVAAASSVFEFVWDMRRSSRHVSTSWRLLRRAMNVSEVVTALVRGDYSCKARKAFL